MLLRQLLHLYTRLQTTYWIPISAVFEDDLSDSHYRTRRELHVHECQLPAIAIPLTFLDWHVLVIFHLTISMFFFTNGLAKLSLCCNIIIRREMLQFIRKKICPKTRKNRRQNLNHTLSQLANHKKGFKRRKQVGPHNYIFFLSRRPAKNLIRLGIYLDNNSRPLSNTIGETIQACLFQLLANFKVLISRNP